LLAFKQIGSIPSKVFLPTIALPAAAKGWMNAVRGARAKALSFVVASALCASPAWSAERVAKSNVPAGYSVPRCDHPAVFARIRAEFGGRHWGFGAVGIRDARETIRKYWPQADMPRRFCEGVVKPLSGAGRPGCKYYSPSYYPVCYPIYYAIIAYGLGFELEWCVVGLDRAWPYDERCRLARP
jgi:hypothetical protein